MPHPEDSRAFIPRRRRDWAFAVVLAWCAGGCGDPAPVAAKPEEKYPGVVLRLALDKSAPLADPLVLRIPEWEDRTGAKVEFLDAATAVDPDLWAVAAGRLPSLPALLPLGPGVLNDADVLYIQFPYAYRINFAARDRTPVALPLSTQRLLLWCREDLYRDLGLLAAWTGAGWPAADFAPPKTWADYLKQAEFFQRRQATKFGCAEAADGGPAAQRNFLVRAQSLAASPRLVPFDPDTGAPALSSPECLRAAEEWLAARKLGPAGDDAAARRTFAQGDAAFLLATVPPTVEPGPKPLKGLAEKALPAPLPFALESYDRASRRWQRSVEPRSAVHFAGGGEAVAVAAACGQPAAAESLLKFLGLGTSSGYLVQGARKGLVPLRHDLLSDSGRFEGYGLSNRQTGRMFELVREGLRAEHYASDLRFPGAAAFGPPLAAALAKIAAGTPPAAALAEADAAWKKLVADAGPTWLAQYRASLGLAPRSP